MYDAIVVGTRCAGASVARLLAEQGHAVLMVDRVHFPRDTVSTHFIMSGGVSLLRRWGLLERVLATNVPFVRSATLTVGATELDEPFGEGESGWTISPRRTVLDKLLVDAAVEAGAELREGVTVRQVLRQDGQVVGIAGHDETRGVVEERAAIVVGADGRSSSIAELVGAERYDVRPGRASGYYAYFAGFPTDSVELGYDEGVYSGAFPTNDGEVCIFCGAAEERVSEFREDVDRAFGDAVAATSARFGRQLRASERASRFFAFRALPGFFRKPFGAGWALVGDAGYLKDPCTGHGITDAFRDAQLLADATHAGLCGEPWDASLAAYQRRRDEVARGVYRPTQEIAGLEWTLESLPGILLRLAGALEAERDALASLG